jgi:ubiquinone/menaquinone biosynthesis C-methylase UbiE
MGDSMALPFEPGAVDLILCNHVYEHVPDIEKLFDEIERVLRVGGKCYLGAASRLTVMEPHYHLPFLSWLPKKIANAYMRLFNKGDHYYENLKTFWQIKKYISRFEVSDYTLKILADPDKYHCRDLMPSSSVIDRIPKMLWKVFYFFLPTYIFVLTKRGE